MSRGTILRLLKKSRIEFTSDIVKELMEIYDKTVDKYSDTNINGTKCGDRCIGDIYPILFNSVDNSADFIHRDTNAGYNIALQYNFNSIFHEAREKLSERYMLNSYSPANASKEIPGTDAMAMLEAVEYLLLGKYDSDIENVMRNPFIDIFSSLSGAHSKMQYLSKFPDDKETSFDDHREILENLRTILSAYIDMSSRSMDYILIIQVWG